MKTALYKVFGAEQSLFFSVPKGKDDRAQRLLPGGKKCTGYLQDGRDTGGIVVRTVVYPVVCQRLVRTQVVEVGTDRLHIHPVVLPGWFPDTLLICRMRWVPCLRMVMESGCTCHRPRCWRSLLYASKG